MPTVPNIHPSTILASLEGVLRRDAARDPQVEVEIYTVETLKIALKGMELERANPTQCVYTDRHGDHCVVGALVLELGGRLPTEDSANQAQVAQLAVQINNEADQNRLVYDFLGVKLTYPAFHWLHVLQSFADGKGTGVDPVTGMEHLMPGLTWAECITQTDAWFVKRDAIRAEKGLAAHVEINVPFQVKYTVQ